MGLHKFLQCSDDSGYISGSETALSYNNSHSTYKPIIWQTYARATEEGKGTGEEVQDRQVHFFSLWFSPVFHM